jgi:hypothetical protein
MAARRSARLRRWIGTVAAGVTLVATATAFPTSPAGAVTDDLWFDTGTGTVTVSSGRLVDGLGREVLLRGFNVSGETKLDENHGLPFASTADAERSAAAMRRLTTANSVRFLLSWAYVEPRPGQFDTAYLRAATAQVQAFLRQGFRVLPDFHQDLYSRYLFNSGSWYTGDGAPAWVIAAGGYPQESCGICVTWGQNITQNTAVQQAMRDFWHNRVITTSAGQIGVQDAFLRQARTVLTHLRQNLSADEFGRVVGFDPINEPYAGLYESGENAESWERNRLWPFYQRFRQVMDATGWQDKPAYVEPNLFWHSNLSFARQPGGFLGMGSLGTRFVFNTHFYDHAALSGVFMWGKASDGQYVTDLAEIRARAAALGTAVAVTEFGHNVSGYTSDKAPTVEKAMYQAMDSGLAGATWWRNAASSGAPVSGSQWQWDIYNGRHREAMNGNPSKVLTEADAWNGEDFSVVRLDDAGTARLRVDARLVDRVYPAAVSGRSLAFTFEDRSRDGGTTLSWTPVPDSLPAVKALVGSGQYAVLVWRSTGGDAPTELRLPASFPDTGTTVVSDLGTATSLPRYAATGHVATSAIATAPVPGGTGGRRLLLTAPATAGALHHALVTNPSTPPTAAALAAARAELATWAATANFPN